MQLSPLGGNVSFLSNVHQCGWYLRSPDLGKSSMFSICKTGAKRLTSKGKHFQTYWQERLTPMVLFYGNSPDKSWSREFFPPPFRLIHHQNHPEDFVKRVNLKVTTPPASSCQGLHPSPSTSPSENGRLHLKPNQSCRAAPTSCLYLSLVTIWASSSLRFLSWPGTLFCNKTLLAHLLTEISHLAHLLSHQASAHMYIPLLTPWLIQLSYLYLPPILLGYAPVSLLGSTTLAALPLHKLCSSVFTPMPLASAFYGSGDLLSWADCKLSEVLLFEILNSVVSSQMQEKRMSNFFRTSCSLLWWKHSRKSHLVKPTRCTPAS